MEEQSSEEQWLLGLLLPYEKGGGASAMGQSICSRAN